MTKHNHTDAGSLTYADAGERMRLSYARLVEAELGRQAWAVAGAVWMLTASYSKGTDQVSASTIAEMCGMRSENVRRQLRALDKLGVLKWMPQHGRRGNWSEVRLPTITSRDGSPETPVDGSRDGSPETPYLEATENTSKRTHSGCWGCGTGEDGLCSKHAADPNVVAAYETNNRMVMR